MAWELREVDGGQRAWRLTARGLLLGSHHSCPIRLPEAGCAPFLALFTLRADAPVVVPLGRQTIEHQGAVIQGLTPLAAGSRLHLAGRRFEIGACPRGELARPSRPGGEADLPLPGAVPPTLPEAPPSTLPQGLSARSGELT